MGSTGTGSFSDYSRRPSSPKGNNGGSSGSDSCGQAIHTHLEEMERCAFFLTHGSVPNEGIEVSIVFNGVRIAAETNLGEEIGYLPTRYNYIKICIDDGYSYSGVVVSSSNNPRPIIILDITPDA